MLKASIDLTSRFLVLSDIHQNVGTHTGVALIESLRCVSVDLRAHDLPGR